MTVEKKFTCEDKARQAPTRRQRHVIPARLNIGIAYETEENMRGYRSCLENLGKQVDLERVCEPSVVCFGVIDSSRCGDTYLLMLCPWWLTRGIHIVARDTIPEGRDG